MKRLLAPKVGVYAALVALALIAAIALGLPELAVLAAPFALALAVGLAPSREPGLTISLALGRDRALEGEDVGLELTVSSETPVERLEIFLELPPGLSLLGTPNPRSLRLERSVPAALDLVLRCERWGAHSLTPVHLRASDNLGCVHYETLFVERAPLKVYPRPEQLHAMLRPVETQPSTGNQVSHERGDGIEFADIRPFVAGDRIRRVNWRASARRPELWVNDRHTERNADVVLFLDTFVELGNPGSSTLDLTVRATAALAEHYLTERDRVGLVGFGGVLRWLVPGSGLAQLYRIVDSVLDTEVLQNYAWKDIDIIPRRTLPPRALVLALTPLLDERALAALLELRGRGFDLALVEISPLPFVEAGAEPADGLAFRLWGLRREAHRARFLAAGVPVALWSDERPLAVALEEVRMWRRHARRAAA